MIPTVTIRYFWHALTNGKKLVIIVTAGYTQKTKLFNKYKMKAVQMKKKSIDVMAPL